MRNSWRDSERDAIFSDAEVWMAATETAAVLFTKSSRWERDTCAEIAEEIDLDASREKEEKLSAKEAWRDDICGLQSGVGGWGGAGCVWRSASEGVVVRKKFRLNEDIMINVG
jgi:hypothetical protein